MMSVGRLTKNESSSLSETSPCQSPSPRMPTNACQNSTVARLNVRASTTPGLRAALALADLAAQHNPHGAVQVDERRSRAQFHHLARAVEGDRVTRDNPAGGTGGKDDHFIRERDRFLEIVSDEQHRLARALRSLPQRKQLGFHPLPRVHVE